MNIALPMTADTPQNNVAVAMYKYPRKGFAVCGWAGEGWADVISKNILLQGITWTLWALQVIKFQDIWN